MIIAFISIALLGIFLGLAFREDLKLLEKDDPNYRKYLRDKFRI
jgi:hypothetical protein